MKVTLANFPEPQQKVMLTYFGERVTAKIVAVRLNVVELCISTGQCAERLVRPWGWLLERDAEFVEEASLVELGK